MASFSDIRNRINSVGSKKKPLEDNIPASANLAMASGPFNPLLPAVNLLPSIFAQRMANRALIRRFLWAGVLLALLLGVLFGLQFVVKFFNQTQLQTLQANAANYNRQLQQLQPYQTYKTSIANERSTLGQVLSKDIDMAKILSTLNTQASQYDVQYSNIGLTVGGTGSCISDPFGAQPTVGCITISGTAPSQAGVSNFFNQLNSTTGFLNAVPASLSAGEANSYSFNGSVSFNEGFYSNAYAGLAGDLDQLLSSNGTGTATTPLASLLKQRYAGAFANADTAQITALGQQVCSFTTSPISSATLASRVIAYGQTVQITIPNTQANAIANDILTTSCAKNAANVTGGTQS